MDTSNYYSMRWSTSTQIIQNFLHECYTTSNFSDVTLVCDDLQTFKAHKIILSAFSPVLRTIISKVDDLGSSVIYLKGIKNQEIQALVDLMYLGQTTVQHERLEYLIEALKSFKIDGINGENEPVSHNYLNTEKIDKIGQNENVSKYVTNNDNEQENNTLADEEIQIQSTELMPIAFTENKDTNNSAITIQSTQN